MRSQTQGGEEASLMPCSSVNWQPPQRALAPRAPAWSPRPSSQAIGKHPAPTWLPPCREPLHSCPPTPSHPLSRPPLLLAPAPPLSTRPRPRQQRFHCPLNQGPVPGALALWLPLSPRQLLIVHLQQQEPRPAPPRPTHPACTHRAHVHLGPGFPPQTQAGRTSLPRQQLLSPARCAWGHLASVAQGTEGSGPLSPTLLP